MAELQDALAIQIDRVVRSSYPLSLKPLQQACRLASAEQIRRWADECPDQIGLLAQALVESLDIWSYTVDIINVVAVSGSIRNELYNERPSLLHQLLDGAVGSDDGYQRLSPVCVTLLSHPLPTHVGLPAAAQTFFLKNFAAAVRDPCVAAFRHVYDMLEGACSALLDLLPPAELRQLEEQLQGLLRLKIKFEDQLLTLLCTLIVGKLPVSDAAATPSTSPHLRHRVFTGDRSLRTFTAIALHVIYACGLDPAGPSDPATQIRLARRAAAHVDGAVVRRFAASNPPIVAKLAQKVALTAAATPAVGVEALAFVAALPLERSLVAVELVEGCLADVEAVMALPLVCHRSYAFALRGFASSVSVRAWSGLASAALSAMVASRLVLHSRMRALKMLFNTLQELTPGCEALRMALQETAHQDDGQRILGELCTSPTPREPIAADFQTATIGVVLSAGLLAEQDERRMPTALVQALLTKQQRLCQPVQMNSQRLIRREKPTSLFSREVSGTQSGSSRSWRTQVQTALQDHSRTAEQTVLGFLGETLSDMERRCETVEAPLRVEEARREAAEAECSTLRDAVTALEDEKRRMSEELALAAANFETERRDLQQRLAQLQSAREREVEGLRQETEQLKTRAAAASSVQATDRAELTARISTLEGTLTASKNKTQQISEDKQQLHDQFVEVSNELDTHEQLVKELELELNDVRAEASAALATAKSKHSAESVDLRVRIASQEEMRFGLEKQVEALVAQVRQLTDEVALRRQQGDESAEKSVEAQRLNDDLVRQVGQLMTELEGSKAAVAELEGRFDDVNTEKDDMLQAKDAEIEEDGRRHETRLEQLQQEAEDMAARHEEQVAQKDGKIGDLKRRAKQLDEENKTKTRTIQHLQDWKSNLERFMQPCGAKQSLTPAARKILSESQASPPLAVQPGRDASEADLLDSDATDATSPTRPSARRKQQQQPFKVPSRASTGTARQTRAKAVLEEKSPNKQVRSQTPTSTLQKGLRRSRRSRGQVPEQENAESLLTDLDDEDMAELESQTRSF